MNKFNRYTPFIKNGKVNIVPFVKIRKKDSDRYIIFNKNTRLDKISNEYYESPDFAWLILQANPEYGSIENFIPNGSIIRIPYPLSETLNFYLNDIKKIKNI